jgi:hypothetical protein
MPFLVAFLPVLGLSFLAHDYVEWIFVGVSTTIGVASLLLGYRVHGQRRALASLAAGIALVVAGRIAESRGGLAWGVPCLVVGALIIAGSHILNAKLCRTCVRCQEHGCESGA